MLKTLTDFKSIWLGKIGLYADKYHRELPDSKDVKWKPYSFDSQWKEHGQVHD